MKELSVDDISPITRQQIKKELIEMWGGPPDTYISDTAYSLELIAQVAVGLRSLHKTDEKTAEAALKLLDACRDARFSTELFLAAVSRRSAAPTVAYAEAARQIVGQRTSRSIPVFEKYLIADSKRRGVACDIEQLKREGFGLSDLSYHKESYAFWCEKNNVPEKKCLDDAPAKKAKNAAKKKTGPAKR